MPAIIFGYKVAAALTQVLVMAQPYRTGTDFPLNVPVRTELVGFAYAHAHTVAFTFIAVPAAEEVAHTVCTGGAVHADKWPHIALEQPVAYTRSDI